MLDRSIPRGRPGYRPSVAPIAVAAALLLVQIASAPAVLARTISSTGTLNPVATVTVGSFVSGIVDAVSCDFNAIVKKGQVCARIDPRPFQKSVDLARASLANVKAQLEQHQASLTYVKASFERQSTLVQRGVVSKDAFESVQSSYGQVRAQIDVDRAGIAQRQAELDVAELNLGYTDIVSPIDGVVLARKVAVGETIAANFQVPSLFVIASDLRKLQLLSTVGEGDIGALKEGDAATFTVKAYPARTFSAKVLQIRFAPDQLRSEVGYGVVLDVDNADLQLKPGMTAAVRFTTTD